MNARTDEGASIVVTVRFSADLYWIILRGYVRFPAILGFLLPVAHPGAIRFRVRLQCDFDLATTARAVLDSVGACNHTCVGEYANRRRSRNLAGRAVSDHLVQGTCAERRSPVERDGDP